MQRDTSTYSSYSLTREQAEPFAIRQLRAEFERMPPRAQQETIQRVARLLADEARSREFQAQQSALARLAGPVYGLRMRGD